MWMNLSVIIMSEKIPVSLGCMIYVWFHLYNILEIIKLEREKISVVGMETKKLHQGACVDGTVLYLHCSGSWMKLYV